MRQQSTVMWNEINVVSYGLVPYKKLDLIRLVIFAQHFWTFSDSVAGRILATEAFLIDTTVNQWNCKASKLLSESVNWSR